MDRRRFLLTSLAGSLAAPLAATSQEAGRVRTIGWLSPFNAPTPEQLARSPVRAKFRELGWTVGHNLAIEYVFAEGREDRLPELAADLVRKQVEVLVANGPEAVIAAARETKTIPIVFFHIGFPVEMGIVQSLARPGGNVTGITSHAGVDQVVKQLEFLKELAPRATRLAWISTPLKQAPDVRVTASYVEKAAPRLGFKMRNHDVVDQKDLEVAFDTILRSRAEALALVGNLFTWRERQRIVDFANRNRLPGGYSSKSWAEAGGLVAYGAVEVSWNVLTVVYIDRILRGARPSDIPIEQPTKFELVINAKTAKALGLTIPPSLLARADQVIE
jgi:putative ABC transport system substrate-binding protein